VDWSDLLLGVFWWQCMKLMWFWGKYRIQRVWTAYVEAVDSDCGLVQTAEIVVVVKKFKTRKRKAGLSYKVRVCLYLLNTTPL